MKIVRTLRLAQSFSTSVRRSQIVCTGEESPLERFPFLKPVSEFYSTKGLWRTAVSRCRAFGKAKKERSTMKRERTIVRSVLIGLALVGLLAVAMPAQADTV